MKLSKLVSDVAGKKVRVACPKCLSYKVSLASEDQGNGCLGCLGTVVGVFVLGPLGFLIYPLVRMLGHGSSTEAEGTCGACGWKWMVEPKDVQPRVD